MTTTTQQVRAEHAIRQLATARAELARMVLPPPGGRVTHSDFPRSAVFRLLLAAPTGRPFIAGLLTTLAYRRAARWLLERRSAGRRPSA